MNHERLDAAASLGTHPEVFRAGALWHEAEMIRQGILIRLVDGPAAGRVLPRPTIGGEITYRKTLADGTVVDETYVDQGDGTWRYRNPA